MALVDITKQDVLDFDAKLSTTSAAAWMWILAYANKVDLSPFCIEDDTTMLARILLAAHFASALKSATSSTAGPLVSESVGGVRRSYGLIASLTSEAGLLSTRYGQQYYEILASTIAGPILAC